MLPKACAAKKPDLVAMRGELTDESIDALCDLVCGNISRQLLRYPGAGTVSQMVCGVF